MREGTNRLPLRGRTIVTTRATPGQLDQQLVGLGATVLHVPLIEIAEPADPGPCRDALAALETYDWLVVTSKHGARRVLAAAQQVTVKLAAVGSATAGVLTEAGLTVELVPARQTAADMVDAFAQRYDMTHQRVLVAQANRAHDTLAVGLTNLGAAVTVVTAYETRLRHPTAEEQAALARADAVALASGSAAQAWAEAIGPSTPAVVAAIGPTTARVASQFGLTVTTVATQYSIAGLTAALTDALTLGSPDRR